MLLRGTDYVAPASLNSQDEYEDKEEPTATGTVKIPAEDDEKAGHDEL